MKLQIAHTTDYRYTEPLRYALQTLCLTPRSGPAQDVKHWHVVAPGKLHGQTDAFGNTLQTYTLQAQASDNLRHSTVTAQGEVVTHGVAEFTDEAASLHPLLYLRPTQLVQPHAALAEFATAFLPAAALADPSTALPALLRLSQAVMGRVNYQKYSSTVATTALQAFEAGAGVCQDQAHVMIAMCRSVGLPARYVSGYFYTPYEPDLASHAWVDVCLDVAERRWASIDVTHACLTDERHVRLAVGTDYNACPPIKGVRQGGGLETMHVHIRIAPL